MLITFEPNGRVEFTRSPELLSLFPDDPKRIERMTDIRFDEHFQRYYIVFLFGEVVGGHALMFVPKSYHSATGSGHWHKRFRLWQSFIEEHSPGLAELVRYDEHLITFATYEDAVKVEVAFVDFLREQGYSMVPYERRT